MAKQLDNRLTSHDRDEYIDFLRAVGLLLLVVAHTWAPEPLSSIRTFDVPLMVFLSALCYKPSRKTYWQYVSHRIKRIYLPVFIFLTVFFVISFVGGFYIPQLKFRADKIIGSYLLLNQPSIGFVWIMRVFILEALLLPLVYSAITHLKRHHICALLAGLYIAATYLSVTSANFDSTVIRFVICEYVIYMFGYSIIIILGIRAQNHTFIGLEILIYIVLFLLIGLISMLVSPTFIDSPNLSKYPPHGLYLLYGAVCCLLLWSIKPLYKTKTPKGLTYLSTNSMWLYLWHILPYYAIIPLSKIPNTWVLRYLLVFFGMIILNVAYQRICNLKIATLNRNK